MRRLLTLTCLLCIIAACDTHIRTRPPAHTTIGVTVVSSAPAPSATDDSPIETGTVSAITPRIQDCPSAPITRLIVQERGMVSENNQTLNLRRGPGTNSPVITRIDPGEIFLVLEGPVCAGDYTWFRIRYRSGNGTFYEGWIAEGDFEQYYAEPYLPG